MRQPHVGTFWPLPVTMALLVAACRSPQTPDAYGTFEATDVVVSAQTAGQIERFVPVEGMQLARDADVALIDTTQLSLQRNQVVAQRDAAAANTSVASRQLSVLAVQRGIAQRAYERTLRLHDEKAATSQQLDAAERDYHVLVAQIDAARAATRSARDQAEAGNASVAQIEDRIGKSKVRNPERGTVLVTYARAGEVVQAGTPLYKIANLDTLVLRAYVSESQLASVRVGSQVQVHVDGAQGKLTTLPGTVSWVSSASEFTPTPVQTRDERADLVYAVKVLVPNRDGTLKIGMPADLSLGATQSGRP
jgi:HlyD family secretion protein